ncbi:metal cation symporter ZIP14-like isoform X2 [Symsagittifera roscoffensis]|uniref:metal cation symporter ZIP14-like isoform X2 n=1 Tax=Symsagittifera roscoffensis TaxID=84072 RepID=UPI00307B267A
MSFKYLTVLFWLLIAVELQKCDQVAKEMYTELLSETGLDSCRSLDDLLLSLVNKSNDLKENYTSVESVPNNLLISDEYFSQDAVDKALKICLDEEIVSKNRVSWKTWLVGSAVVLLISVISMTGALLIPFMNAKMYHYVLSFLVALAVGSLSGSSIFHLIPQAFNLVSPGGDHDYLNKGAMVVAGIYLFFMTERLLKTLMHWRKMRNENDKKNRFKNEHRDENGEPTSQGLPPICSVHVRNYHYEDNCCKEPTVVLRPTTSHKMSESDTSHVGVAADPHLTEHNGTDSYSPSDPLNGGSDIHNRKKNKKNTGGCKHGHQVDTSRPIATVAWMVIFGDGIHNFIDGLAIGAAFVTSTVAGLSTSVAVICEELPHELGDFAILLNAGMTWKQALFYNFLSATSCFAGLFVGILLGELAEASGWIFGLAGGMFLYISLVDMMPEMSDAAREDPSNQQENSHAQFQKLRSSSSHGHADTSEVDFKLKDNHSREHVPKSSRGEEDEGAPSVKMLMLQSGGMVLGWVLMFVFAKYGEVFTRLF